MARYTLFSDPPHPERFLVDGLHGLTRTDHLRPPPTDRSKRKHLDRVPPSRWNGGGRDHPRIPSVEARCVDSLPSLPHVLRYSLSLPRGRSMGILTTSLASTHRPTTRDNADRVLFPRIKSIRPKTTRLWITYKGCQGRLEASGRGESPVSNAPALNLDC